MNFLGMRGTEMREVRVWFIKSCFVISAVEAFLG